MSAKPSVVVFGPTGTAGSAVLQQCIRDPRIAQVRAVTRRPLPISDPKLRTIQFDDFAQLESQRPAFSGVDACFFCLGIAQAQAKDEAEYRRITLDYPVQAARLLREQSPAHSFHFLSGQGADPTGKSWIMFARVKGEAENALAGLGLRRLFSYRPGYIHPSPGHEKRGASATVARLLFPVLRSVAPGTVLHAAELARAMIEAELSGSTGRTLAHREILSLARQHTELPTQAYN